MTCTYVFLRINELNWGLPFEVYFVLIMQLGEQIGQQITYHVQLNVNKSHIIIINSS